jgi:hypothetical protein
MATSRTPRKPAGKKRAGGGIQQDPPPREGALRAAIDAGIEMAQRKLSELGSESLSGKKEAVALLEKLLKLRREYAEVEEQPTEIRLIWNTSEDEQIDE